LRARLRKAVTESSLKDSENVRISREFQPPNVRNRRIPPPVPLQPVSEIKIPPPPPLPAKAPAKAPAKEPTKAPTKAPPTNFLEELKKRAKRVE